MQQIEAELIEGRIHARCGHVARRSSASQDRAADQDRRADGRVFHVVCWRLDRLGRTAKGLTALFADLEERGVNLVSLREGINLSTPAGRMLANMLASVAQFETECRAERVLAGQVAARARGKTWGGRKEGTQTKAVAEKADAILTLHKAGKSPTEIARSTGVSRPTVYAVIRGGW